MDKNSGNGDLSPEDRALWDEITKNIRALPASRRAGGTKPDPAPRAAPRKGRAPGPGAPSPARSPGPGIDRATAERLRRGRRGIDARLDLHGMTQAAARAALERFVRDCYDQEKRCLLIITGKGRRPPDEDGNRTRGVIRERVPGWLAEPPLAPLVLQTAPAQPRHGGTGALYVLLRRRRD